MSKYLPPLAKIPPLPWRWNDRLSVLSDASKDGYVLADEHGSMFTHLTDEQARIVAGLIAAAPIMADALYQLERRISYLASSSPAVRAEYEALRKIAADAQDAAFSLNLTKD